MHQWSCLSQPAWTTFTKRREENRIYLYAAVSLKRNGSLRSTYCTIEANYWQTRSIARPICDSRATCSYSRRPVMALKLLCLAFDLTDGILTPTHPSVHHWTPSVDHHLSSSGQALSSCTSWLIGYFTMICLQREEFLISRLATLIRAHRGQSVGDLNSEQGSFPGR